MNPTLKVVFFLLSVLLLSSSVNAQIVVNGYNSRRYHDVSGPRNAVSVSYGYNVWIDGDNVPLPGYSSSRAMFHRIGDPYSIEKSNISLGINLGYERQLSNRFCLKVAFSTTKLTTGATKRIDLMTTEKSKFTQLGLYGKYTLNKDLQRKLQFQWIVGPELIYARKDVIVEEYVLDENSDPEKYHQDITIAEAAVVTGLGLSYHLSKSIGVFSEMMMGVSLPGNGLKSTVSSLGLKYNW
jgi:hypothetical protein